MSKYIITKDIGGIKGLSLIEQNFDNNNKSFFSTYDKRDFYREELKMHFVQDNEVYSKKGVLRGMHVNLKHPQGKLIRAINGKIFDVVVDLRKESNTYKKCFGIELSGVNKKQIFIPEGMGHGYYVLEQAIVSCKVTTHYTSNDELGFAWNSQDLEIEWPIDSIPILLSEADQDNKDLIYLEL